MAQSQRQPPPPPCDRVRKVDRISILPNSIIRQILSGLTTREAILTGVLKKRWQNVWASLPCLTFHYSPPLPPRNEGDLVQFANSVTGVLLFYQHPRIQSFTVDFPYMDELQSSVIKWVRYVTKKGVEELHLRVELDSFMLGLLTENPDLNMGYNLPRDVYHNGNLVALTLGCFIVAPPSSVSWDRLKRLTLSDSTIKEDAIRAILVGSPLLERLVLADCKGFSFIDASCSSSLKSLGVHGFASEGILMISAPHVESMTFEGLFACTYIEFKDVSSLKNASVCVQAPAEDDNEPIYVGYQLIVIYLLSNLLHLDQLTIGHSCIKAVSTCKLKDIPFPCSNWKHLIVNTRLSGWEVHGITALFEISPKLESLLVDTTQSVKNPLNLYNGFPDIESSQMLQSCVQHLKSVKIVCSKSDDPFELRSVMAFTHFLLSNSTSLQVTLINKA